MFLSFFLIKRPVVIGDTPEPPPGEKQIQGVLKKIDEVEGVDAFVAALNFVPKCWVIK